MTDSQEEKFNSWVDMDVPVDLIDRSPFQVRSSIEGLDELGSSMSGPGGLLNPILVRPLKGRFELVSGERRWGAAVHLGWKTIPARVKKMSDAEAKEVAITDNEQRNDTNPIEKAKGYKLLNEPPDAKTMEQIGQLIGKSKSTIGDYIAMLSLPEEIQKWVAEGTLSPTQARPLTHLTDPDCCLEVAKKAIEGDWSAKKIEHTVDKVLKDNGADLSKSESVRSAISKEGFGATLGALGDLIERLPFGRLLRSLLLPPTDSPVRSSLALLGLGMLVTTGAQFIGLSWVSAMVASLGSSLVLVAAVRLVRFTLIHGKHRPDKLPPGSNAAKDEDSRSNHHAGRLPPSMFPKFPIDWKFR